MMTKVLTLIVLALLVGTVSFIAVSRKNPPASTTVNSTSAPMGTSPEPTIDASDLREGGSSYRDPQGVFSFLYPSDYALSEQNNAKQIRIYKKGPTQKGQTEMYDGVILHFETIHLEKQTLSEWVDATLKTMSDDGTSRITKPKQPTMVGPYSGYTYTVESLGTGVYYAVQKDTNSPYGVLITSSVYDPTTVGFQEQVYKILSTLEIFK